MRRPPSSPCFAKRRRAVPSTSSAAFRFCASTMRRPGNEPKRIGPTVGGLHSGRQHAHRSARRRRPHSGADLQRIAARLEASAHRGRDWSATARPPRWSSALRFHHVRRRLEGVEYDLDADDERFLLDTVNPRLAGARTASDAATRLSLDAFEVLVDGFLEREALAETSVERSLVHENHLMQHQLTLQDEVVSLLAAAAQLEGELAMPCDRCRRRCLRRCHGRLSTHARVHHHQLIKAFAPEWAGRDPSDDSANDAPKEKLSTTLPRARAVRLLAHLIVHHGEVVQPLDAAKAATTEPQSTKAALLASAAAHRHQCEPTCTSTSCSPRKRGSVAPHFPLVPLGENWTRAEGIAPGHVSAEPHMRPSKIR